MTSRSIVVSLFMQGRLVGIESREGMNEVEKRY
jgi:hypothetical protein